MFLSSIRESFQYLFFIYLTFIDSCSKSHICPASADPGSWVLGQEHFESNQLKHAANALKVSPGNRESCRSDMSHISALGARRSRPLTPELLNIHTGVWVIVELNERSGRRATHENTPLTEKVFMSHTNRSSPVQIHLTSSSPPTEVKGQQEPQQNHKPTFCLSAAQTSALAFLLQHTCFLLRLSAINCIFKYVLYLGLRFNH